MMESNSRIIEIKSFMDKCLVCDIEVQEVFLPLAGLNIQTNKWLHLEDWLEIDGAIEKLLDPFRNSETLDGFETDVFYLGGAIRVDCRKVRVSRTHKKILGNDRQYLPIALHLQIQKVNTQSLIAQIQQFEAKLNLLGKTPSKSVKSDHSDHTREYDPTFHSGADKGASSYVPYTASVKSSNGASAADVASSRHSDNEPYSPKPVTLVESSPDQISESPPAEIPTYKPARIGHSKSARSEHPDARRKPETDKSHPSKSSRQTHTSPSVTEKAENTSPKEVQIQMRRATRRIKTTNAELFGSDDSDQEEHTSPSRTTLPESPKRVATPIRTPSTNERLHDEMKRKRVKLRHDSSRKNPLDGWLSGQKKRSDRPDKHNGKSSKSSSHHRKLSETEAQNQMELQQIKELSELRDTIKSKRKSPPQALEILSLTHLSSEEILGTFEGVKPILDNIFKVYSKRTKITGFDGINHMKTLMLIDDKKQLQMMNFLRDNYQPNEKGVPSLTDLYINALVPEWTVNVFMKEFNFTRTEAIERLQAQEESSAHNGDGLDSS